MSSTTHHDAALDGGHQNVGAEGSSDLSCGVRVKSGGSSRASGKSSSQSAQQVEVRVDVDDRRVGIQFIMPPETERSSPVTNDEASLIR